MVCLESVFWLAKLASPHSRKAVARCPLGVSSGLFLPFQVAAQRHLGVSSGIYTPHFLKVVARTQLSCLLASNYRPKSLQEDACSGILRRILSWKRITAVARLPDHSNSLLSVLLLESSSSTKVTPRPQLHLDCAVFNLPKRHATSLCVPNRAGPVKKTVRASRKSNLARLSPIQSFTEII